MPFPGLCEFPSDPMPGVRCLLAWYNDPNSVPMLEAGHAALHLVNYAYGIVDPHPVVGAALVTPGEIRHKLEAIQAQHDSAGFGAWEFDWVGLALALMELLKLLWKK